MADIGSGLQMFGQNLAAGFEDLQKKQAQQQAVMGLFQMATQMQIPDPNDPSKMLPAVDKKFQEAFMRMNREQQAGMKGYLQSHIEMADTYQRMIYAKKLEEQGKASVTGPSGTTYKVPQSTALEQEVTGPQRAAQLEATKTSTERTKQIIKQAGEEAGKVNVPGFGMMTPPQLSAHMARMERLDVLKKKSEPILNFENQLQNAYGLGIQDVVDAAKPREFTGGDKTKYTGTPYVDATGNQIDAAAAAKDPEHSFVFAGENKAMIPLTHQSGLGWQQIVPKAKAFSGKLEGLQTQQTQLQQQAQTQQAQQVIALLKDKDPAQLTPEEQAALAKAKGIIGQ